MRHEKAQALLHLARILAGSAEGLTLDEMADVAGVGRRTGSVLVSFRASGMLELAWHLFTWADKVEILQPASLQTLMETELQNALAAHQATTRPKLS
jgi:predicted DNA-binding transcriptional regulator YafY